MSAQAAPSAHEFDARGRQSLDDRVLETRGDRAAGARDVHHGRHDVRREAGEREHPLAARGHDDAERGRRVDAARLADHAHVDRRGDGGRVGQQHDPGAPDVGGSAHEPGLGDGFDARRCGESRERLTGDGLRLRTRQHSGIDRTGFGG